jgi:1-acyl-sn-glycerol-3-phosphate acyltransferase
MKVLRLLYVAYGAVVFAILFALLFPLLLIPIVFPAQFQWTGIINRWWARLLFFFLFIPFKVIYEEKLDRRKQYIFCPNHFSYLDIPTVGLNSINTIFVGKSDIGTFPVFGFMYRKLHITVNRASLRSRGNTVIQSMQAIDEGKSLVIFPEGGIVTEKDPVMGSFKDGAFRLAIEKQIPIVPVTIPYNWIILPPEEFLLRWHVLKVIFHQPIDTTGLTLNDVGKLKQKVFDVIENELLNHLEVYENRSRIAG